MWQPGHLKSHDAQLTDLPDAEPTPQALQPRRRLRLQTEIFQNLTLCKLFWPNSRVTVSIVNLGIILKGITRWCYGEMSQADDVEMQVKDGATPDSAVPYSTFSTSQIWSIVCLCGLAGFFSPFSAYMYFPALKDIAAELDTTMSLIYVSITVYLVMQGVAPAFFGDLADQIGRRPVYVVALAVYFIACVALALQTSYAALLILRILQSAGCSGLVDGISCKISAYRFPATIALGVIVVADIVPPHQRGTYTGAMLTGYVFKAGPIALSQMTLD